MADALFTTDTFSPLFSRILEKRGFLSPEAVQAYVSPQMSALHDPFLMKGMTEAVERFRRAAQAGEKIMVHGDYDIDGITGAALTAKTLQLIGAQVQIFLPDRQVDGYGVSLNAIKKAAAAGVKIFVTVDCGVTAVDQITQAKALGLDVIVIDHHRIPETGLPPADIILNPLQEDCPYPFNELSAAGLAFKLSQALLGDKAFQFLDLATLSTIGDVAPLKDENRVIVKHGLEVLGERKHVGLHALSLVSKIRTPKINVGHVGFMYGPRINAAGRMSSPEIALQLLMTESKKEAQSIAHILDEENKERQKEERLTVKEAIREVDRIFNYNRDRVIVVGKQGWHAGVIGIVASRLVERYNRPAMVIAFDGESGKASARSIKGFHLYNTLNAASEHLEQFGGHELAAGFSIRESNLKAFRAAVNAYAHETYGADDFVKKVKIDEEIELRDLSEQFICELELMEPHGMGNSRPTFLTRNLKVRGEVVKKYSALRFYVSDGTLVYEASWTDKSADQRDSADFDPQKPFDLFYTIKQRIWEGRRILTLEVKSLKQQQLP